MAFCRSFRIRPPSPPFPSLCAQDSPTVAAVLKGSSPVGDAWSVETENVINQRYADQVKEERERIMQVLKCIYTSYMCILLYSRKAPALPHILSRTYTY